MKFDQGLTLAIIMVVSCQLLFATEHKALADAGTNPVLIVDGNKVVEEDTLDLDAGVSHKKKALESLAKRDFKTTAAELRLAIDRLHAASAKATQKTRHTVAKGIRELEQMTKDLDSGVEVEERRIDRAFTVAEKALRAEFTRSKPTKA